VTIRKSAGRISPEEMAERKRRLEEELTFWRLHRDELIERYPEQLIAVTREGKVVAVASDLFSFLEQLDDKGIKPRDVWTSFMTRTAPILHI
jgi:hypothetical protein